MSATADPVLAIRGLDVSVAAGEAPRNKVVDAVNLDIGAGEIVALVGESGSGKTMIGRSVLGLLPPVACIDGGEILFDGRDLARASEPELRSIRGARIGMVFQEPMVSLNPALRIGFQVTEALRLHGGVSAGDARARAVAMLERVKIADPERCLASYPHEFSGGMRQRIMLASVFASRPRLLIADEPTTALDAIIQAEVMEMLVELARENATAVLLISHDLGMVAQHARRVFVMREGRIVEGGETREVLLAPRHEYTRALLDALPRRDAATPAAPGAAAALFEVRGLTVEFRGKPKWFWQRAPRLRAVDGVDLDVRSGEMLAVVGESGSGKTTIARTLVRLLRETAGSIRFDGQDLGTIGKHALLKYRLQTQMVFQDPYSSLDPRMTVAEIVSEALRHVPGISDPEREARVREMLVEVGLGACEERLPHELSGGQRQRVCIARAIAARPRFVVADEPVSALDVTIQKQVLDLLVALKRKFDFTCLFVSHDLGVVERIADRVVVMFRGRIIEAGPRDAIFDRPQHPYTRRLLQANPRITREPGGGYILGRHRVAETQPPQGYRWYPFEGSVEAAKPVMVALEGGHRVACLPL